MKAGIAVLGIFLASCAGAGATPAGSASTPATTGAASTTSSTTATTTPPPATPPPATTSAAPSLSGVKNWGYQLQNMSVATLAATPFDCYVIDYSTDGTAAGKLAPQDLATLHSSKPGRVVLAYLSIGEAENYRYYWQASWTTGNPSFIGPVDPQWPGNYKVQYWDPAWQAVIFGSPTAYLDQIIDQGFDGCYLDIIDAYQFWGPGGPSGLDRATAEQEMVAFVEAIANYARTTRGKPNFLVVPQNAEELSSHPDYVQAVSAIGIEDLFFDGDTPQAQADVQYRQQNIDVFLTAGKTVLSIDYVTTQANIDTFYAEDSAAGYIPYASDRNLDVLTVNPGHAP